MTQQLDSQVRAAFDEIVRHSPELGAVPSGQLLTLSSSGSGSGSGLGDRRRPQVLVAAAAAAVVVVVGGAGLVAVTRSAPEPNLRPATTPDQGPSASTESTVQTGAVTTTIVGPAAPPLSDERFAALLTPVGAADVLSEVRGLDESWVASADTFVTPEGRVLSVQLQEPRDGSVGETRRVGPTDFIFLNEDGRHIYLATGQCRSVVVVASNEDGSGLVGSNGTNGAYPSEAPWSVDALKLMATVDVDSSGEWVAVPDGWARIDGGFSELLYDAWFTVLDPTGTPSVEARLQQSDAPLGHLLAVSQQAFVSAAPATVEGLPSNADGERAWLLRDAAGAWYVGWNTPYGSALLSVASATQPVWAEIAQYALEPGHPEFWADAVLAAGGGAGSADADADADAEADAPVATSSAAAEEQGAVLTTVTLSDPAPATACGPQEGG